MTEIQVFRICPKVGDGKFYEYAECTRKEGKWPNEKWYTTNTPLYVGILVSTSTGGYGDGGWRRDYFSDHTGKEHIVKYSYDGNTCFREVPSKELPPLQELCRNILKNTNSLETDNPLKSNI